MIQTEYRLVSVGVSVGPAYFPKTKKVKPYLKLMASVHLNMDYEVSVLRGSPIGYARFMSCFKVQGNFLLLFPFSTFVGS